MIEKVDRIAAGVDGHPEGRDAAVLGAAIADAADAELMLVAVHPDPLVDLPTGVDWKALEHNARVMLHEVRGAYAPGARVDVETDVSIARGLHRVAVRERRDLLVLGSSRQAPEDRVRIGKRTRQLLCHFECAMAIAPHGLHDRAPLRIERIGVGYDGGREAIASLKLAGSIAKRSGAQLLVYGVVDDRLPSVGWSIGGGMDVPDWDEVIDREVETLREQMRGPVAETGVPANAQVARGRPAGALLALSDEVDLLVIGSRRWGPMARLLLGSTGEALLHDARCSVLVVPRPHD